MTRRSNLPVALAFLGLLSVSSVSYAEESQNPRVEDLNVVCFAKHGYHYFTGLNLNGLWEALIEVANDQGQDWEYAPESTLSYTKSFYEIWDFSTEIVYTEIGVYLSAKKGNMRNIQIIADRESFDESRCFKFQLMTGTRELRKDEEDSFLRFLDKVSTILYRDYQRRIFETSKK